eukprot:5300480-Heterocapsa_arctica.AAC.1
MHTPHCAEYGRCVSLWRSSGSAAVAPAGTVSAPVGGTVTPASCPRGRYVGRPVLELASSRAPSAFASSGASACTSVPAGRSACPPCRRSGARSTRRAPSAEEGTSKP